MLTKNEVMVNIPPREGETVGNRTRVVPGDLGFVMVGHSLGSVYARRFAFLYPKLTSALVMWDAIPSQNTGPDKNEVRFGQALREEVSFQLACAAILFDCAIFF